MQCFDSGVLFQVFLLPGAGSEVHGLLPHRPAFQDQAHLGAQACSAPLAVVSVAYHAL